MGVAVGVLMLGLLAAWMGGVFKVKTPDGVIVLENIPKDSEILVDGDKITFAWPGVGKPLEIRAVPGQRKVEVKKDGFKTFGEVVTVKTDKSEEVTVRLEPLFVDRPGKKEADAPEAKAGEEPALKREVVESRPKSDATGAAAADRERLPTSAVESPVQTQVGKPLVPPVAEGEEVVLFNGKNLEGWRTQRGVQFQELEAAMLRPKEFISGGELHSHPNIRESLETIASYQNFVLRLEYRIPVGAAQETWSHVDLIRQRDSAPIEVEGMQITGGILYMVTPGEAGDLCGGHQKKTPRIRPRQYDAERPIGMWNEIEIRSSGQDLTFLLNGRIVNQARTNQSRPYHIVVNGWWGSAVRFRNIRLRPLLNTSSDTSRGAESRR